MLNSDPELFRPRILTCTCATQSLTGCVREVQVSTRGTEQPQSVQVSRIYRNFSLLASNLCALPGTPRHDLPSKSRPWQVCARGKCCVISTRGAKQPQSMQAFVVNLGNTL